MNVKVEKNNAPQSKKKGKVRGEYLKVVADNVRGRIRCNRIKYKLGLRKQI